jgi:hypothetical protein
MSPVKSPNPENRIPSLLLAGIKALLEVSVQI